MQIQTPLMLMLVVPAAAAVLGGRGGSIAVRLNVSGETKSKLGRNAILKNEHNVVFVSSDTCSSRRAVCFLVPVRYKENVLPPCIAYSAMGKQLGRADKSAKTLAVYCADVRAAFKARRLDLCLQEWTSRADNSTLDEGIGTPVTAFIVCR
jgi:hypothetical protein